MTINFFLLNKDKGKEKIGQIDAYIKAMKPFERKLKMDVAKEVTLDEFVLFLEDTVCDFTEDEESNCLSVIKKLQKEIDKLAITLPKEVYILKTNGKDEWNSAYTRGDCIILPEKKLKYSKDQLFALLAHEFFHIYSRFHEEKRNALYSLLGFKVIDGISDDIKEKTLVNPDALCFVSTEVNYKNELMHVTPVVTVKRDNIDIGKDIIDSIRIKLCRVNTGMFIDADDVEDYLNKVCINTENKQHPEETLAENFTFLLMNQYNLSNNKILEDIKTIIMNQTV